MGAEQTKQELEVSSEPLTYFAINIKQPDKLHIVPSDTAVSSLVTRALETHYRLDISVKIRELENFPL